MIHQFVKLGQFSFVQMVSRLVTTKTNCTWRILRQRMSKKEKIKLANQPYIRLVQLLLDSDITVEGEALKRPDWLSIETLNEVLTTLEGEYNSYFY